MPSNKTELLEFSQIQFNDLLNSVKELPIEVLIKPGACGEWSIKDILAHLHAWHNLFLRWYNEGMAGQKPYMPDAGYSWKDTPELNTKIYQEYKDAPFEQILELVQKTHQKVVDIIQSHSDGELFTKKFYSWTGSSSLGVYIRGAASSHYDWANKLIKKFKKSHD